MTFKILGNLPVERAKDTVCFLQWCGLRVLSVVSSAIIYNIVSEKVTRWPVEALKGNSEVHLHTPTSRRDAVQQKVPFTRIRLLDAVTAKQKAPFAAVWREAGAYNIVENESDPLTRRPVDLFEKEPLKGNSEVHLHTPTKFGEDPSKDLGGDRERTHTQTLLEL